MKASKRSGMICLLFLIVFGFSLLNVLHETIAAFLGAAAMLGIGYFIITDPGLLRKSLLLFGIMMNLSFIEDLFYMPPAVLAILGSTALLLWVRPDVNDLLQEVDWTTLVLFMSLFMMVDGIQEVGAGRKAYLM